MGFYPPASLVRDAQRRGVRVAGPCVNASGAKCTIERDGDGVRVRVGLGYVREVRSDAAERVVAEREREGSFRDLADLAARCDLRREQVSQLVRSGACDVFGAPRRRMLWQLATMSRPVRHADPASVQLALPIPPSEAPPLPEPDRFERVVTDYETMGLSVGWHLMALVRPHLPPGALTAAQLRDPPDGTRVLVGGMVTARQRPGTAGGIVFLLLEDETGMANVIVRPRLYEANRAILRAEPLVMVWGTLERRDRNLNVVAERVARIAPPPERAAEEAGLVRARAAVPPGQSFARGRR
jgi:error-prone DNA polymerase